MCSEGLLEWFAHSVVWFRQVFLESYEISHFYRLHQELLPGVAFFLKRFLTDRLFKQVESGLDDAIFQQLSLDSQLKPQTFLLASGLSLGLRLSMASIIS